MTTSLQAIDRLQKIFADHGWPLEPNNGEGADFDRFAEILGHLEPEGQELMMRLTRRFLLHSVGDYSRSVSELAARLLPVIESDPARHVIVLPLQQPKDHGVPKSGAMVTYMLRLELGRRGIKHHAWDRPELVKERLPDRKAALVVLADDFVGSGSTALAAYEYFKNFCGVSGDEIIVCTLIAQSVGLERLATAGVQIAAVVERGRGISDSSDLDDASRALQVMDDIEEGMNVPQDFRRGLGQCEALVSLARCPNNTFPIYWIRARGGTRWQPPFHR